jgi:tRNA(Ile)-lysidine synthase
VIAEAHRADGAQGLSVAALAALPAAVRARVLRSAALDAGCPPGALTAAHVARIGELVTGWHGQRGVDLPGGVRALRRAGQVCFDTDRAEGAAHGR